MRISFGLFDIVGTIKIVIGIDNLVVVPFTVINSCCFLSSFDFFLVFKLSFWRIGNPKNLVVHIQTRVDDGDNHPFPFITLLPGLGNSNNFVTFDALRFFSCLMAIRCFWTCRSSHCCCFFYRFFRYFRFCFWNSSCLFRSFCFFNKSCFCCIRCLCSNCCFFCNFYFLTSNCCICFCCLWMLFFSRCLLSSGYKLCSSTYLAGCLFFSTRLCRSKYQNSP